MLSFFINQDFQKINVFQVFSRVTNIGSKKINYVCKTLGIFKTTKWFLLTDKQLQKVATWFEETFVGSNVVGTVFKKKQKDHIAYLKQLRNYRSNRLFLGLPARGQNTHSNAKTAKRLNLKNMLRNITYYRFYIVFNNIKNFHFVISDFSGNILFKKTSGFFDKSSKVKQTTVFSLIESINLFCIKNNIQNVLVFFLGTAFQKISLIKDIFYQSFTIHKIYYVSNRVFNGCRKKKQRRLLFLGKCLSGLKYQF